MTTIGRAIEAIKRIYPEVDITGDPQACQIVLFYLTRSNTEAQTARFMFDLGHAFGTLISPPLLIEMQPIGAFQITLNY